MTDKPTTASLSTAIRTAVLTSLHTISDSLLERIFHSDEFGGILDEWIQGWIESADCHLCFDGGVPSALVGMNGDIAHHFPIIRLRGDYDNIRSSVQRAAIAEEIDGVDNLISALHEHRSRMSSMIDAYDNPPAEMTGWDKAAAATNARYGR